MQIVQKFYPVFVGMFVLGLGSFVNGDDSNQAPPSPPPGPHVQLTDEQRSCLDGKLGVPGEGERPSHEQFEAAMSDCGVSRPAMPATVERSPAGEDSSQ